jgi:hypothetical protein
MDDKAFQELLENARLAAAWLKGEDTAARITFVGEPTRGRIRANPPPRLSARSQTPS